MKPGALLRDAAMADDLDITETQGESARPGAMQGATWR
jgi:hypothetical protein